jgi:dihydrofolate reductase (trimethoprim resistance protein)
MEDRMIRLTTIPPSSVSVTADVNTPIKMGMDTPKFQRGDRVRKIKGSEWQGIVVGEYSTKLTPEGYAVESDVHAGSVQIYPVSALEKIS